MLTLIHSSNITTEMRVFYLLFTFDKVNNDSNIDEIQESTLKSQLNFPTYVITKQLILRSNLWL